METAWLLTFGIVSMIGVIAGTLAGERLLLGLSRERFKVVVSCAIGLLGIWFLLQPVSDGMAR